MSPTPTIRSRLPDATCCSRLVDDPSAVDVRVVPGSPTLYEAIVAPDDIGQVVGREGRIVKSIRSLVAAAAQKRGEYATFEIVDPQG